ncbi:MAG: hypothetical protein J3R72DRAFT_172104, partial [Linnemannia gamsii]
LPLLICFSLRYTITSTLHALVIISTTHPYSHIYPIHTGIMVAKIYLRHGVAKDITPNFVVVGNGTRMESVFKVDNRQFKVVLQDIDNIDPLRMEGAKWTLESIAQKVPGQEFEWIPDNMNIFFGDRTFNINVFPITAIAKL